jgi:hypothetical protein
VYLNVEEDEAEPAEIKIGADIQPKRPLSPEVVHASGIYVTDDIA